MKSLSLSQPHLLVMVGVPGSGKTFFAEKFAATFHAPYVSYEKLTRFVDDSPALDDLLYYQLEELLKTRQTIILEGVAETRNQRIELGRIARAGGYELILVWVQTEPTTAKSRAIKEKKFNATDYDKFVKHFDQPHANEKPVVISGKHTYATQAKVILKKLSGERSEISNHVKPPIRSEVVKPLNGRRNITIR